MKHYIVGFFFYCLVNQDNAHNLFVKHKVIYFDFFRCLMNQDNFHNLFV